MGTLLILTCGTCLVLYKECQEYSGKPNLCLLINALAIVFIFCIVFNIWASFLVRRELSKSTGDFPFISRESFRFIVEDALFHTSTWIAERFLNSLCSSENRESCQIIVKCRQVSEILCNSRGNLQLRKEKRKIIFESSLNNSIAFITNRKRPNLHNESEQQKALPFEVTFRS